MNTPLTPPIRSSEHSEASVVLEEVAPEQWRVLDAGLPPTSIDALIGFVCRTAGVYEVTTMTEPLDVSFFTDLDSVRAVFTL